MATPPEEVAAAIEACEALCRAYDERADSRDAEAFAELYLPNGEFDRLGQVFIGRAAIAGIISSRPPDLVTKHVSSNIRIEVDPGARSASGRVELRMQRRHLVTQEVSEAHVEFLDQYLLTEKGWRLSRRKAVAIA